MISVIIPMFNSEKSIINALDSVKNQICEEKFEIIVINDGSSDKSRNLVEGYISKNNELNFILINQENKGVSAARNAGLKIAKGEYIALLDADDVWLPEKTAKQMKYLRDLNLKIDFIAALRNGEKIWFPYKKDSNNLAKITLKKLLFRLDASTPSVLFKKKILENTGFFDEAQRYAEDANFWMRISLKNSMYILSEDLVYTGNGKKSFGVSGLSANLFEMEKGLQKNLLEMYRTKNIKRREYIVYFVFFKLKYAIRLFRRGFFKEKY